MTPSASVVNAVCNPAICALRCANVCAVSSSRTARDDRSRASESTAPLMRWMTRPTAGLVESGVGRFCARARLKDMTRRYRGGWKGERVGDGKEEEEEEEEEYDGFVECNLREVRKSSRRHAPGREAPAGTRSPPRLAPRTSPRGPPSRWTSPLAAPSSSASARRARRRAKCPRASRDSSLVYSLFPLANRGAFIFY
eukprot:31377-Pelagococcus_subviridis.AAC.4